MPLIAQVTGAVALTALIVGPWWASTPDAIESAETAPAASAATASATAPPASAPAATSTVAVPAEITPPPAPAAPPAPAHLNLDVRHSFGRVDLLVTVDGKPAIQTKLEGSGKRFGVFGKRAERGYTRTLDLTPGVHLVRIRVSSASDKFDQVRVERFDLGSSAVASMRISADKSGLSLVAERPPVPAPMPALVATPPPVSAPPVPVQAASAVPASPTASRQDINALTDVLYSVRSMLIWIAGFVATTATAFLLEEWFKKRKQQLLALGRLSRRRHRHRPRPADPAAAHAEASPAGTEPEQAS